MEHIVFHSIMGCAQENGVLSDLQHSFLDQDNSHQTQLINFIENIWRTIDQQKQVDMILLDFSKACNVSPHQHLLTKLANYGSHGNMDGLILSLYCVHVLWWMENHQIL